MSRRYVLGSRSVRHVLPVFAVRLDQRFGSSSPDTRLKPCSPTSKEGKGCITLMQPLSFPRVFYDIVRIMKHVSFTQLMTYVRCPEHFLFKYVLGMVRPPKKILKHGFALHETFAYHFDKKKLDRKGITANQAKEFFYSAFGNALEDYEVELEAALEQLGLSKEYLAAEKIVNTDQMIVSGMRGIDAYFKELNSKIHPDLVETAFAFPASREIEIVGRLDLTDTKDVIHELKTTRITPNLQDIRTDAQISLYQIAYQTLTGRKPKGISKDYIVLGKREAKIVRFQVTKPFINQKTLIQSVLNIMEAVKHNIFYCLHPAESWFCSKQWCGYYKFHAELRQIGLSQFMAKYAKRG